ncbi:ROK family protein [Halalkalibacterium halodurans]|uniref:Glucose kinase n=1 Tax=Halalkalibacterium halodurans TaxID=86665 RepID=A0A2K4X4E4_ALKHA|nr:ROK family protein [Halalkalibacterium halodurans]MED4163020.1 ROK family protein [Halalkalibacterium halodurans]TES49991.1 ROK family protein [Halalkalibacterium halodurans]TPE70261.1 ROK family protein [Halalkalibacterium halodurans]SOT79934.1 ROK family protein [Halalkalibacterium halodurans]
MKVGIDLGGTKIKAALVSDAGEIISVQECPTEAAQGPEEVMNKMMSLTEKVTDHQPFAGIGIGAPGPLSSTEGTILSPPNLPGWDHIHLVDRFQEQFQCPVKLDNDANVAALAEALLGSGQGFTSVFYLTISTGIGGGYVLDGSIVHGASDYAGEIGNMIVQPNGYQHANLNPGSLEGLASGTAIGRMARERFGVEGGTREVFDRIRRGDHDMQRLVEEAMDYLAIGIANIAHTVNPDVFVLGGGVMNADDLILPIVKEKVSRYLYPGLARSTTIVKAKLGGDSGVLGAAMLV